MEQRRFNGKSHWYHETQSSTGPQDVLPLVPEAAHVEDRFLLDLVIPEDALLPFQSWLQPARQLAHELFPDTVLLNRLHTFSAYERMSTALTVAQVYGVQRLCNHYAARLTPLPGPDSSRESNHRLAQITQYARQLASSPSVIDNRARQHLCDVGLSAWDIALMNQIIGYVGFQARVVATFQAWLGQPVRWVPGLDTQSFADVSLFQQPDATWHSAHEQVELRFATAEQLECLSCYQPIAALQPIAPNLVHQPTLLTLLGTLLKSTLSIESPAHNFTTLLTSRINGSASCFNQQATSVEFADLLRQSEHEIERREQQQPVERPLFQAIQLLTRAPDRFSAAQFNPFSESCTSVEQAINLLAWSGLCGWLNRLKIALGETH
ncbi:CMD domain-containing protein [Citrobacter amalonaticus]|uniref:carboxymuconolactone decarboxylase family protein n=1 Tax=Citrobacter TaxID=544 RepID=UPI0015E97E8C|nr:carboxymuconolactone decarboxylase family protein [Citrobacter sp. RHB35-C17]QMD62395.1 CMD domain-containing protein [Citrobacter sp. RHB35-C17]HCW3115040.1 CMD domain-containing protein [Citrobacter amalonaticus]HEM7863619.1 CMD domain-containing protein [Citrobacter amalonaticus]